MYVRFREPDLVGPVIGMSLGLLGAAGMVAKAILDPAETPTEEASDNDGSATTSARSGASMLTGHAPAAR